MSKVTLKGHILVPELDLIDVLEELGNHIALTRAENGCLVFEVSQNSTEPNRFSVYEEFESPASFQLHQQRMRTSKWGSVTRSATRHYEIDGLD